MDKRELLKSASSSSKLATRKRGDKQDLKDVKEAFTSDSSRFKNQLYSMTLEDIHWLSNTFEEVNKLTKRRISKSEIVRAGLGCLQKKTPDEILKVISRNYF